MKKLLEHIQIEQKIRRIAYQIYEQNYTENSIDLVGIDGGGSGYTLAELIFEQLKAISNIEVRLTKVDFNKENEQDETTKIDHLGNTVVLVDDVINSGKTIMTALSMLWKKKIRKVQVATLVNRSHLRYPIQANFVGYALSTSLNETVKVDIGNQEFAVYLL